MLILFTWLVFTYASNIFGKGIHHDEICGGFDGRRLYLELEERGTLLATNWNNTSNIDLKEYKHCSLEIVTCPSCIISIQFSFLNITNSCAKNSLLTDCECNYVWIYEAPYENMSGERFCGSYIESDNSSLTYKSKTRSTIIIFYYKEPYRQAFILKYFSERNRHFINTYPKKREDVVVDKYLSSPFFPKNYPRDLSVEYILNCKTIEICKIKLIFTDFQISRSSLIEFFDWNGQRMFVTTGSLFRPPILISGGPTMVIRFYANGGTNTGFKLKYSYILGDQNNSTAKINTGIPMLIKYSQNQRPVPIDCGGLVDNLGGAITMMEMSEDADKVYDCFWIIKPPQGYLHIKTHLYAKVTKFEDFAGNTQLLLKEGLNSEGYLLANITYPSNLKIKEHIVSINTGIYISLAGIFNSDSKLEIVYAAFSYRDCVLGSDFLCQNQRCISTTLQCDGFDNCGDNSDEPEVCETGKGKVFTHTPNFYFPKSDRDFDLKTATIVFIISSLALMCLIVSLIVLLYRMNMRGSNRRQLQTHLQTINDLLEESSRVEEVEIIISDEPPNYEAPPDYVDVVKTVSNRDSNKRSHRKQMKKHVDRLLPCNDNLDISSLSTTGSTSNLISTNINVNSESPIPEPPPISATNGINIEGNITPERIDEANSRFRNVEEHNETEESKSFPKWMEKSKKFEFNPINLSNNERIGFFSYLRATNRHHCLSDSDLSSVVSIAEEEFGIKHPKMIRSFSNEELVNTINPAS